MQIIDNQLIIAILVFLIYNDNALRINIKFVPLSNDTFKELKPNTARIKHNGDHIICKINAFGKIFDIVGIPSTTIPVQIIKNNITLKDNFTSFTGTLLQEPNSKVHGYISGNRFLGIISKPEENYHLEPKKEIDMVIMIRNDHIHNKTKQNKNKYMLRNINAKLNSRGYNFYVPEFRTWRNKICDLQLVADHTFSRLFYYDKSLIVGELSLLLQKANDLFTETDFDNDGHPDFVGLRIGSVIVYESPDTQDYFIANEYLHGIALLEQFSIRKQYQTHCMEMLYVARTFLNTNEPCGYTYQASPYNQKGICSEPYNINGYYKMNNIGYVNILSRNTGRKLSRGLLIAINIHEIGHAFGASHDPKTSECSPGDNGGNYLMATVISYRNRFTFSPCSVNDIYNTLERQSNCFLHTPLLTLCGNGIRESNEECDCGTLKTCDAIDPCCYPQNHIFECRFRETLQCLPQDGPCCSQDCHLLPRYLHYPCSSICYHSEFCDGMSSSCPQKRPLPFGFPCSVCPEGKNCICSGYGDCMNRYRI